MIDKVTMPHKQVDEDLQAKLLRTIEALKDDAPGGKSKPKAGPTGLEHARKEADKLARQKEREAGDIPGLPKGKKPLRGPTHKEVMMKGLEETNRREFFESIIDMNSDEITLAMEEFR